jgi:RNA polymerase sigma-70 factor (ECF subfamily)
LNLKSSYNPAALTDAEIIEHYRKTKDIEILGSLYKRYMPLVYGVCIKYLKNKDDSQDAVMQIFEVLVTEVLRFEIRSFKGWLYGVSRNHCLMKLRKDHSEKNRLDQFSAEYFMESTINMHPIEENNDEAVQAHLKDCMEQLKEEQRRCIELFYYQQHCYREIADELKQDENKVKSYIQNGKRNLKICLESKSMVRNAAD